ncbi:MULTISPECIES: universal stress protein [unclassified Bacillus (in: firmicutes)]|uniref:universal stress protein n=1 Tax=unclassified Bacillus (in: firmicutes) TaxID=185979 RepID=UPI001BE8952B|nr:MULTISPECIES: universal stress protein [unclassified Bacillus (in: firmicutes)]MBT2640072.1 universal stress protein [Bacillus sp. ISL-39]MBT2685423.1 universal stress protein [Bacillus sp. ISL-37]
MYQKILLAADGSEHSKRAADHAIMIANCQGDSKIEIVYVVDGDSSKSDVLSNWNSSDINDKRKERLKDIEQKAKESGVNFEIKILHGEPGPAMVEYTNQNKFDLVVIGSRGLNGLQELMLGSVSHKVAKRANCPVMIVK